MVKPERGHCTPAPRHHSLFSVILSHTDLPCRRARNPITDVSILCRLCAHRAQVARLVVALAGLCVVVAQYPEGSGLYTQQLGVLKDELNVQLENLPDLVDIYFPLKYLIPTDFYRIEPSTTYVQNVIFDPCRGHGYDCCQDVYGTPEFRTINGTSTLQKDDGSLMDSSTRCVCRTWWTSLLRCVHPRVHRHTDACMSLMCVMFRALACALFEQPSSKR